MPVSTRNRFAQALVIRPIVGGIRHAGVSRGGYSKGKQRIGDALPEGFIQADICHDLREDEPFVYGQANRGEVGRVTQARESLTVVHDHGPRTRLAVRQGVDDIEGLVKRAVADAKYAARLLARHGAALGIQKDEQVNDGICALLATRRHGTPPLL